MNAMEKLKACESRNEYGQGTVVVRNGASRISVASANEIKNIAKIPSARQLRLRNDLTIRITLDYLTYLLVNSQQ